MKRLLFSACLILAISASASAQSFTYYFPHIATGTYSDGAWKTSIFITNSDAVVASGTITFTRSDGSPYNIAFLDDVNRPVGSGNQIPFQLGSSETRKFVSVADAPLTTGFATVTANAAVLGTAMFTQFNLAGTMIGEAGVPAGIPLGWQAVFVDTTGGFKTGVAIANPNASAITIQFELLNTMGQTILRTSRQLGPNGQTSFFVHEMFPEAPPMVGRLQFFCTNPMVSIALRFEPSFTLFTTMPPVAIAGRANGSSLPLSFGGGFNSGLKTPCS